jgi:hypothetical protein
MNKRIPIAILALLLLLAALSNLTTVAATPTAQPKFADPAFQRTWERTDTLVASGQVKRSYFWGPAPNSGPLQEDYAEGPGGKHLVQYFDKSRIQQVGGPLPRLHPPRF